MDRLAAGQLRRPAAQVRQQCEPGDKPPPHHQAGQGPRKKVLVVHQKTELDTPQRGPEEDDDGELHPQEQGRLLQELSRGHCARCDGLVDLEHGRGDDVVHGAHGDEDGEREVDEAIVEGEAAVDVEFDGRPGNGEQNRDGYREPDKRLGSCGFSQHSL